MEAGRWMTPDPRMGVKAWLFLGEALHPEGGARGTGEAAGPKLLSPQRMRVFGYLR